MLFLRTHDMWPRNVVGMMTLALTILVVPLASGGQQLAHIPRLGFLSDGSPVAEGGPNVKAFRQGLHELGWVEGQNLAIEYRWAEGRLERLHELAGELVRLPVDIIVATRTPASQAAKNATTTIPIVSIASSDPVVTGLVASLARPGGNLTGPASQARDLSGKRLEFLKEAVPTVSRVAVMWNVANDVMSLMAEEVQGTAKALGLTLHPLGVRDPDDFERAFAAMTREPPEALYVIADPFTFRHQRQILDFEAAHRLPAMHDGRGWVEEGGLIAYGPNARDIFRRAATYVDKILKGAKPADLPVEQPMKFELIINLKTAKALGLTIPPTLLFQADEVIQ